MMIFYEYAESIAAESAGEVARGIRQAVDASDDSTRNPRGRDRS